MSAFVHTTVFRIAVVAVAGVATAVIAGTATHSALALMVGWIAAGAAFCGWTGAVVGRLNADQTRRHALREDPGRAVGDVAVLVASVGALVGVGMLIAASGRKEANSGVAALVGVLAVVTSWMVVHTLYTLRYARLYFSGNPGGIDFNADNDPGDDYPGYADFAYLAFTIGMTYQVSDTQLTSTVVRHTALRHAMLSFLLGAIILACTINLISQLASGGGG